jgi:hypothetical protein
MFERFLERLSKSKYKRKFVIKGGMLIAAIVGLDTRSTMDLDTTLNELPLTEEAILKAVGEICDINLDDGMIFEVVSIAPIRKDDEYGGFCVKLNSYYDTIVTPLSVDISTGDIITPCPIPYEFGGIFDEELRIQLLGYNIETIMSEKLETILRRGIYNTRPRDFYDIFILATTQNYDKELLKEALLATSEHRGSKSHISDIDNILYTISKSDELHDMWEKYQSKFAYAKDISYDDITKILSHIDFSTISR